MAIYDLDAVLNRYGDGYLILEYNHLFIASSLREEVWLLQRKNDQALIDRITREAAELDLNEVRADRDFDTYSGGQKAILGCLLILALIRSREICGLKLLLNNILDSISGENRVKLFELFQKIQKSHGVRFFTQKNNRLQELL